MIVRRARIALGTLVEVGVMTDGDAMPGVDAAFAVIAEVERRMSRQDPASDLARINAAPAGEFVTVAAATAAVLARAAALHALTGGAFDASCGSARTGCGFEIEGHAVARDADAVQLSLDGIAKGYAVDCAVDALREAGIAAGWVNAGGDLRAFGAVDLPVELRVGRTRRAIVVRDRSLATSEFGHARRVRSTSTLAGARGRPQGPRAATVLAHDCMTADALTKVVAIAGRGALPWVHALGAEIHWHAAAPRR